MKDQAEPRNALPTILPRRLRTYLYVNLALAIAISIVMAVRTELRTGRYLLIDVGMILFFSAVLATLIAGPLALVEIYLYRKKKGAWYEWKQGPMRPVRDVGMSSAELQRRRSDAYRERKLLAETAPPDTGDRTRLFHSDTGPTSVTRAALLMTVADKLERAGKREAAERCYRQIIQRFADSPEAQEAARRLASSVSV